MQFIKLHDNYEARPFYLNVDTIRSIDKDNNTTRIYETVGGPPRLVK